jgi:hypothetical protein
VFGHHGPPGADTQPRRDLTTPGPPSGME